MLDGTHRTLTEQWGTLLPLANANAGILRVRMACTEINVLQRALVVPPHAVIPSEEIRHIREAPHGTPMLAWRRDHL
jgi:hypothetical protein